MKVHERMFLCGNREGMSGEGLFGRIFCFCCWLVFLALERSNISIRESSWSHREYSAFVVNAVLKLLTFVHLCKQTNALGNSAVDKSLDVSNEATLFQSKGQP